MTGGNCRILLLQTSGGVCKGVCEADVAGLDDEERDEHESDVTTLTSTGKILGPPLTRKLRPSHSFLHVEEAHGRANLHSDAIPSR